MLVILSPAKTLDIETKAPVTQYTQAPLLSESRSLINICASLSPQDISALMKVSDKIAALNVARFGCWSLPFSLDNAKQALFTFKGDVYTGLQAETLSQEAIEYAQNHLVILSGLYGLLRPLDLMQAYRLEMGTRLENDRGINLYQFWGNLITLQLNERMKASEDKLLVNLASNEYFKAIKKKELDATIITPVFKDQKNGQYKVISFYAKKARGLMARYIIEEQITSAEQLKGFNSHGYYFKEAESTENELVFYRESQ